MNDASGHGQLVADADLFGPGAGEYLRRHIGGVFAHLALVVGVLNVDPQDGDAPRVDHAARIDLDVVFIAREHRRARGQSDGSHIPPAHLPFEFAAETFDPPRHAWERADSGPALESVAAKDFRMYSRFGQIAKTWDKAAG